MFRFNRGRLNQQQSEETLRSTLKSGTPNIEQGMSNDEVFLLQYSIFLVLRFDVLFKKVAEGLIYGL